LFKFSSSQHTYDIEDIKIGGQPGQYPTVMMGSIFYRGDKIVEDEEKGIFDKKMADERLSVEAEFSAKFGNPRIVDVVASFPDAAARYVEYIADAVDSPFLIDGATEQVRTAALKRAREVGVINRAIYNSITPMATYEELRAVKESGIRTAILLTLNAQKPTLQGRIETLENLLALAKQAGVEQYLVDTTIIDTADPGMCAKICYLEKEKYGYPVGCGPHNAIDRWNQIKRLEQNVRLMATVVANVFPIVLGANFLLYGPMKNAPAAYEMCAIADAYISYSMKQEFGMKPESKIHPITRVFRKE
jgi:tetrahydromethanopterin S-methyltransferase subunit H